MTAPLPPFLQPTVLPLPVNTTVDATSCRWGLTGVATMQGTDSSGTSTTPVAVPAWYAALFAGLPPKTAEKALTLAGDRQRVVQPQDESLPADSLAGLEVSGEPEFTEDVGSVGAEDEGEEAYEVEVEVGAPEEAERVPSRGLSVGTSGCNGLESSSRDPLQVSPQIQVLSTSERACPETATDGPHSAESGHIDPSGGGGASHELDLMKPCEKCTTRANRGGGLAQIQLILAKAELSGEGSEVVRKKVRSLIETKKVATEHQRKVDLKHREGRFNRVGILHVRTRSCRICGVAFHNAATHARFWETVADTCTSEEKHLLEQRGLENQKRQRQKNREAVRMRNTLYYFSRKLMEKEEEGGLPDPEVGDPESETESPASGHLQSGSSSNVPR